MKLKNLIWSPPGQWHYTQPESKHYMQGLTFQVLLRKIADHRTNMNYTPVASGFLDLSQEIEDAICQAMPPDDQTAFCQTGIRRPTSIHWSKVEAFLKSMAAWLTGSEPLVEQSLAEKRAATCAGCPFNVPLSGCGVCRQAIDVFRSAILKRQTAQDANLRACGVCGCELKAAVHFPLEALKAGHPMLDFPKWCWRVTEPRPAPELEASEPDQTG